MIYRHFHNRSSSRKAAHTPSCQRSSAPPPRQQLGIYRDSYLGGNYAAMTRLPVSPRVSPAEALVLVQEISSRFSVVDLTMAEYVETIRRAAAEGISGGTIYDALHLQCARKVNATAIYTWNNRHFRMIAPDLASIVQQPLT